MRRRRPATRGLSSKERSVSITEAISLVAMILLAGGVASRLVEFIKGAGWSARAKWALSVALSAAVGLATAWLAGDVLGLASSWESLTAAQVFAFIGAVYATANGFYVLWFKPRASRAGDSVA
jgi:multisubunit Na+/H+ antiporter MnhB subunit